MRIALGFLLLIQSLTLVALQWPVGEPLLIRTFGESEEGVLETGIRVGSPSGAVRPYLPGEMIFRDTRHYGPGVDQGVIVLQHDNGFRSCYGRLEPAQNTKERSYFKEEDQLGRVTEILRFSVRDVESNLWVNPLFMFTAPRDRFEPRIEEVLLVSGDQTLDLSRNPIVPSGDYRLLLRVTDRIDREDLPVFPYQIKVRYLGSVIFSLSLDSLSLREGVVAFEDNRRERREISFTDEGLIDGGILSIGSGRGELEVEAVDYSGNHRVHRFSLNRE